MKNSDLAHEFARGATRGSGSNMFCKQNVLYSYGHHFMLAIRRPDKEFILNGETYSKSTSAHQRYTREACDGYTIPFGVLRTALMGGNSDNGSFIERVQKMDIIDSTDDEYRDVPYIDPKTGERKTRQEHMLGAVLFSYQKKYFLSATDSRAKGFRLGYFMVELPKKAASIDEAIKSLRPIGIKDDTPYERQGEFFFVPVEKPPKLYDPDQVYEWIAYNYKLQRTNGHPVRTKEEAASSLNRMIDNHWTRSYDDAWLVHKRPVSDQNNIARYFQTGSQNAHIASELKFDAKKHLYAKGDIVHPEHKRVKLGKIWHRVYVNRAVRNLSSSGRID